jgi:hypothetical protein
MSESIPRKLDLKASQSIKMRLIAGKVFPRIAFGSESEDWGADRGPCHDCGATKDQFHALGCDVERCPSCGGQVIYCECEDDAE